MEYIVAIVCALIGFVLGMLAYRRGVYNRLTYVRIQWNAIMNQLDELEEHFRETGEDEMATTIERDINMIEAFLKSIED